MTKDEAIEALITLAKRRFTTVDGEWGCCHTFEEALTGVQDLGDGPEPSPCDMHDEAVELSKIIATVRS